MTDPNSPPDPVERFAGYLVTAVGALMLGLAGLCSLGVAVETIRGAEGSPITGGDIVGFLMFIGGFGGIPMGAGFLILRWGWRLGQAKGAPTRGQGPREVLIGVLGVAIAIAGGGATIWLLLTVGPALLGGGRDSGYALIGAPIAFVTGLMVVLGVWLVLDGYRLWRPRPPPASPPPR